MWWWYLYYPLHYVDHFVLKILHKTSFTRNWILPIWIWFTAHVPFVLSIITGLSHQHYYLSRMGAISKQWYYMGKSIVIVNPHICKRIFKHPPKQVDKGWIVAAIQESGFIAPVMFSTPHPREDIDIAVDIITKAKDEHSKDVVEYLDKVQWHEIKGTGIMDVFEHCLFIAFYKNKLTPQERSYLFKINTNLLKVGIILLGSIPNKTVARLLGLEALGRWARKKIVDAWIKAHGVDVNDPVQRKRAELFGELFLLNVHAPLTTLPYWIMKRMEDHWEHVKHIQTDEDMFQFFVEALRLRVAPPDIGWQAQEDFYFEDPDLPEKRIFIPKGFGLVCPTSAINLNPEMNPNPFELRYKLGKEHGRDPENNIIFGFPLKFLYGGLDYTPTRGCIGIRMCHFMVPRIMMRWAELKKQAKPSFPWFKVLSVLVAAIAIGVGVAYYLGYVTTTAVLTALGLAS